MKKTLIYSFSLLITFVLLSVSCTEKDSIVGKEYSCEVEDNRPSIVKFYENGKGIFAPDCNIINKPKYLSLTHSMAVFEYEERNDTIFCKKSGKRLFDIIKKEHVLMVGPVAFFQSHHFEDIKGENELAGKHFYCKEDREEYLFIDDSLVLVKNPKLFHSKIKNYQKEGNDVYIDGLKFGYKNERLEIDYLGQTISFKKLEDKVTEVSLGYLLEDIADDRLRQEEETREFLRKYNH